MNDKPCARGFCSRTEHHPMCAYHTSPIPGLVYVSGPMTGLPDFNYPAFDSAAARLRELGYEVINPAETAGGTIHLPRSTFLRIDIGYVMAAEAVALLPGWSTSKGSKLEVLVAEAMDLPIHLYHPERGLGEQFILEGVDVRGVMRGHNVTRHGELGDAAAWLDHTIPPNVGKGCGA